MRSTVSARLFDPLWLLTRQWQTGEFQAEDAGTPVMARVRASSAMFSRCHLGELPPNTAEQAPRYDVASMPLDALVERRPMRPSGADDPRMLALAVEAGLHFLRMLELQPMVSELPPRVHRPLCVAAGRIAIVAGRDRFGSAALRAMHGGTRARCAASRGRAAHRDGRRPRGESCVEHRSRRPRRSRADGDRMARVVRRP